VSGARIQEIVKRRRAPVGRGLSALTGKRARGKHPAMMTAIRMCGFITLCG
jgi:hypothetical protein